MQSFKQHSPTPKEIASQLELPPLAVALWSLRGQLGPAERLCTLDWLQNMRVTEVEVAGFCNETPSSLSRSLENRNMKVISLHGPVLRDGINAAEIIEWVNKYAPAFKTSHICLASAPQDYEDFEFSEQLDKYSQMVVTLDHIANELGANNFKISYHPYFHDFKAHAGKSLVNELAKLRANENFGIQFDTYWGHKADFQFSDESDLVEMIDCVHITPPLRDMLYQTDDSLCIYSTAMLHLIARQQSTVKWILENDLVKQGASISKTIEESLMAWKALWYYVNNI